MSILFQTRFFTTVNDLPSLPNSTWHEVAFVGRSNAGKSTAINLLCNQKRLAFASKTPGRTQHINFFTVGAEDDPLGFLVDLPGYGYAQVPGAARKHWGQLLTRYIQERPQLAGLVVMMDARHPFTELDEQMLDWFATRNRPAHILLTKADKLTHQEKIKLLNKARQYLAERGWPNPVSIQLFSALKRIGIEEATETVLRWLDPTNPIE